MKKQKTVFLFLIILTAVFLYSLLFYKEDYGEIVFSVEPGFYEEAFDLEIYAPKGMEIYYTLDGSSPSDNSIHYEGAIRIDDVTDNPNVYSSRDDLTAELSEEYAAFGYETQFAVPDYNVDKCNVIRAIGIDEEGNCTQIKTANYFIGFEGRPGYDGLYIITINTDSDNFFDYEKGIYVLGKSFDEFKQSEVLDPEDSAWWWGNYRNLGPEWERYTNVCIFKDGVELVNQDATVRAQGGISRSVLPRSLNIKAEQLDGNRTRFYGFDFNGGYFADAINISSGGNRYLTKMNDYLIHNLVRDRDFATMNYYPCALFLDGEYWGVYHFSEKYDCRFFADTFDLDKDEVVFIKNGCLHEGESQDLQEYYNFYTFITSEDFSQEENYEELSERIDIQSCIDYYAVELYIARKGDWPVMNEGLWRSRDVGRGEYADGRWRWALYDVNSACLKRDMLEENTIVITRESENGKLFDNLCKSEEFRKQFTITLMDIVNTDFDTERTDAMIDDYIYRMQEPLEMSARRFCGGTKTEEILDELEGIKYFLDNRKEVFTRDLAENFGLNPDLITVNISINDSEGGSVHLNTIDVPFEDGKWSGDYYRDYPVTMTASSYEGYHFVGWTGDVESTQRTIEVPLDTEGDSVNIEAVFEKDSFFSEFE